MITATPKDLPDILSMISSQRTSRSILLLPTLDILDLLPQAPNLALECRDLPSFHSRSLFSLKLCFQLFNLPLLRLVSC